MPVLIQIVVSLIALYIVLSIINSMIVEYFAHQLNSRGKFLKAHILYSKFSVWG